MGGQQRWCFRRAKKTPPAILFLELLTVFGRLWSDSGNGMKIRRILFPVPIVAHDFINRVCANFITDGTQLSGVGKVTAVIVAGHPPGVSVSSAKRVGLEHATPEGFHGMQEASWG